jgi:hypothetical protein
MSCTMLIEVELMSQALDLVDYAILRLANAEDLGAAEYLEEQLKLLRSRLANERFGGGDVTCLQIDRLLRMLGGEDG